MFTPNTPLTFCLTCTLLNLREFVPIDQCVEIPDDAAQHAVDFPGHVLVDGAEAP